MLLTQLVLPFLTFASSLARGEDAKPPSDLVVDLGYAKYQGVPNALGNTNFLGVRFAAPPIGDLRFREPRLPSKTSRIKIADTQPNRCRNGNPGPATGVSPPSTTTPTDNTTEFRPPPVDEDCLFLNVVVPGTEIIPSAKLPVVVWIHGGGYFTGSASYPGEGGADVMFNGNDLVRLSNGKAIVVLIQHRLGLYGFLSGEDVKKGGALNAGLLDQQFALQWVQRHISKFGGDPQRVTLWGESAGAGSVFQQLIANGGQTRPPLFQTAMLSSLYYPPQWHYNDSAPEKVYGDIVRMAGCDSSMDKLSCLRGVDAVQLDKISTDIQSASFYFTIPMQPVVDGTFIRERAPTALAKGKVNTRNVLAVANSNEGSIFVDPTYSSDLKTYISGFLPTISSSDAALGVAMYEGSGSVLDQAIKLNGEFIFICPTYALLRSLRGQGYKGEYAVPPAAHYEDAPYYFPSLSVTGAPIYNDTAFITTFGGSFLDFAVHGTPNVHRPGSLLPSWPKWSEQGTKQVVFNRTESFDPDVHVANTPSDLLERCRFWDSIGQTVGH